MVQLNGKGSQIAALLAIQLALGACVTGDGAAETIPSASARTNLVVIDPGFYTRAAVKACLADKEIEEVQLEAHAPTRCEPLRARRKSELARFRDYAVFGNEGRFKRAVGGYTDEMPLKNSLIAEACGVPGARLDTSSVVISFFVEQAVKLFFGAVKDALKEQIRQLSARYSAKALVTDFPEATCFIVERGAVKRSGRDTADCTARQKDDRSCWGTDFQLIVQTKVVGDTLRLRPLRLVMDEPASKELNVSARESNDHGWGIGVTATLTSYHRTVHGGAYSVGEAREIFSGDLFKGKVIPTKTDGSRNAKAFGVPQYFSLDTEKYCDDLTDAERQTAFDYQKDCVEHPDTGAPYTDLERQTRKTKVLGLKPIETDSAALVVQAPARRMSDGRATLGLSVTVTEVGKNKPREAFLALFEDASEPLQEALSGAVAGALTGEDTDEETSE